METGFFLLLWVFAFGSNIKSSLQIVGNNYALPGEFPYYVSIHYNEAHYCGGALISKRHVLTAAHCLILLPQPVDLARLKVVTGVTALPGGQHYYVAKATPHPDFDVPTYLADVAVITLQRDVIESPYVKTIQLPVGNSMQSWQQLEICGFGASQSNGPTMRNLKKMSTTVSTWDHCKQSHPTVRQTPGLFCAYLAPGYGVCSGDSGGPVTAGRSVIYGVVSAANEWGCGSGWSDLFTYVPHYLEFIYAEMRS